MPSKTIDISVFCADIGSVKKGNFGWAGQMGNGDVATGTDITDFTVRIADELRKRRKVALGFECPLFVPLPDDPMSLTKARSGEKKAWSAGAGSGVLATGLTQTTWVLQKVRLAIDAPPQAFLDWASFANAESGLFLWEAFVTGQAKGSSHVEDAEIAVQTFHSALPNPKKANVVSETQVFSLIGAALLRAAWSDDLNLLSAPCLVIQAHERGVT
ncbi:MAG TPA: hypothetical protein PLE77_04825 [Kiritimatiellia bacterium]|nr:hypothetical protein [Kiritimatiellia bacterium]